MNQPTFTSVLGIYKMVLKLAGDRANTFKKSLVFFLVAFIAQGLAFGMFYPLLKTLFAKNVSISDLILHLGLMIVFTIISLVAKWKGHDFDFTGNVVDIVHDLRTKLGVSLRKMPLEKLSSYKTGELNSILSSNVDESVVLMGMVASIIMQLVVVPLTIIGVTFFVDWHLAILMLVIFPIAIPLYFKIRKENVGDKTEFNKANAELESDFIEYIQGLPVLRAVNKTGQDAQKLQKAIKHVRSVQKQGLYKTQVPYVFMGLLIETVLLIILFAGAFLISNNTLALITLGASIVIVARLTEPMAVFVAVINLFDLMASAFKRIHIVLEIKPLRTDTPVKKPKSFDIAFNNVDFSYENQDKKLIKNFNLYMPSHTMTAFVGYSGSGKTTLTRLVMRYADIQSGDIKIGGINIKSMEPNDLMKHISVVFQDVYLFDDTIFNNIKMGSPDSTNKQIEDAARAAHCHEFISQLPHGYQTKAGDIGGSLSGGEKQRISIARAILKNAPIVILDEPTAALDTESEIAVQKAIEKLVQDKTVIVIAHRLSTIAGADKILVIDKGEIAECGNHKELLSKNGKYFKMWAAQQRVKEWQIDS